jgi:hypothetical protein
VSTIGLGHILCDNGIMVFSTLILVYMLQLFKHVQASATNITIDDYYGDSLTGVVPTYSPTNRWNVGNQCPGCWARPDYKQPFHESERVFTTSDGTCFPDILEAWHDCVIESNDAVSEMTVTVTFNGKRSDSAPEYKFTPCIKARRFMRTA